MKKTIEIDTFCDRQFKISVFLHKIKIVNITGYWEFYEEITHRFGCRRLEFEIRPFLEKPLKFLIRKSIDKEGWEVLNYDIAHDLVEAVKE
jgi:hypothetical protein